MVRFVKAEKMRDACSLEDARDSSFVLILLRPLLVATTEQS